jgi:alpha-galactosidase
LVLNLARPDVRDYVLGFLDRLLTENDIAYLVWDYNRNWSEPGWDQLPPAEQKRVYVEFTRSLYAIMAELQHRHPKVEFESCSGGGGRADLGILRYVDEIWPTDNTDPFDRLTQQDGFTYAFTPQVMMTWVIDSPHWLQGRTASLNYRMLSAMQGALGISGNIAKWSDEEMAAARRLVAAYHQVQPTIAQGELYRLISPRNGSEFSATQTVNREKTQSVVFMFIHSTQEGRTFPRLKLKGLDPAAEYNLTFIEGKAQPGTPTVASGAWWMNHGLDMDEGFSGDFQAAALRLDRK